MVLLTDQETLFRDFYEKRRLVEVYGERIKQLAWSDPGLDHSACTEIVKVQVLFTKGAPALVYPKDHDGNNGPGSKCCDCTKHLLIRLHDVENKVFAIAPMTAEGRLRLGQSSWSSGARGW